MSRPVLLATIARNFGVEVETVEAWSQSEGFPLAGDGVARLDEVRSWLAEAGIMSGETAVNEAQLETSVEATSVDSQSADVSDVLQVDPAASREAGAIDADQQSAVEWVTIRVPVVKGSSRRLAARLRHTFSLRSRDLHIREGYGYLIDGCQKAQVRLSDNTAVDNASAAFRYLGELLSQVGR